MLPTKKEERRTRTAHENPGQGAAEQHLADALSGRGPSAASAEIKGRKAQVGRILVKQP